MDFNEHKENFKNRYEKLMKEALKEAAKTLQKHINVATMILGIEKGRITTEIKIKGEDELGWISLYAEGECDCHAPPMPKEAREFLDSGEMKNASGKELMMAMKAMVEKHLKQRSGNRIKDFDP